MRPRGAMPVNVGRGKHVVDEDPDQGARFATVVIRRVRRVVA